MHTEKAVYRFLKNVLTGNSDAEPDRRLARIAFFTRENFLIPRTDATRSLRFLRYAAGYCVKIMRAEKTETKQESAAVLHVHNSPHGTNVWADFLNVYGPDKTGSSVIKNELMLRAAATNKLRKIRYATALFRLSKKAARDGCRTENALLLFDTFLFLCALHELAATRQVNRMIFTGCYEPDSNLAGALMKECKVAVDMALSASPLQWHLRHIVADRLLLTNPYQQEELSAGISVTTATEIKLLPSLQARSYLHVYEGARQKGNGVAVYTSGIWKRKAGNTFFDDGSARAEEMIFRALNTMSIPVKVYMHPHERRTQADYELSMQHYRNYFSNASLLSFPPMNTRTDQHFDDEDLAVCAVSNIVSERLSVGCKVLVVYPGEDFPIKGSALDRICAKTEEDISVLVKRMTTETDEEYFTHHGLEAYRIVKK